MRFVVNLLATLLAYGLVSDGAIARQNEPPATPAVTEPAFEGRVVNAADVHMESSLFSDPDAGDAHLCTDWEIWTIEPSERVWVTLCITGVERLHTHLGDGIFENSHAGRSSLRTDTGYRLRVRHRDNSNAANSWSGWGERSFVTGPPTRINPLELGDVSSTPVPSWRFGTQPIIFGPASPAAFLRIENGLGEAFAEIRSLTETANEFIDSPPLSQHWPIRIRVSAGGLAGGLVLPETELRFFSDSGLQRTVYLPIVVLAAGEQATYWVAAGGSTYLGDASQVEPDFSTLARSPPVPWAAEDGYRVEVVAGGFTLPVNIAFVPDPLPDADAPVFYVTELYGTIKVMRRNGTVDNFATGLLNFPPTGNFPGSGEQGLTGIAVEPGTRAVYASMLYETSSGFHFPKVVRFGSSNGGRTADSQTTILDMFGEHQGQSHQISNLTFGPDGKLYVHMGDGFFHLAAMDLDSFRGKILRVNPDGTAPADNPFYDEKDGFGARDYVYASGFRNPFGGAWRLSDSRHYEVENGPGIDRLARVDPGANFGYDGTDESMNINALFVWNPSVAPVNIVFVEQAVFGGSGFPADRMGHAFVSCSGPTWVHGPRSEKRIAPFEIDADGNLVAELPPLIRYVGAGRATTCGLAAGPDGLYFTDLYNDSSSPGPTATGSRVLRVRYVGKAAFHADIRRGPGPLAVRFSDVSQIPNASGWEWDFGDGRRSTDRNPVHLYAKAGVYNVRLAVTGQGDPVIVQRNEYIEVTDELRVAFIGGAASPVPADAAAIAALTARGFDVQYYEDDDAERPRGEELAHERNLVVISSTIQNVLVLTEFRDVQTPVLFWEQTLLLPVCEGLADDAVLVQGQTAVNIVDTQHPVTMGLDQGRVVVYSAGGAMNIGTAPVAQGVRVLAERDDTPGQMAAGVVETGDELLAGRVAPARRAFLFIDDATFPLLTPSGRSLFDRSVCWASGIGAEFVQSPADVSVRSGVNVTLSALARGVAPNGYVWRRNGIPLSGENGATLTLTSVAAGDEGFYDAVASGACNSATSERAMLTVRCAADFNLDANVNSQDLFDFLNCFFTQGCAEADVNVDGAINSQDFFDFLVAFFTPCSG